MFKFNLSDIYITKLTLRSKARFLVKPHRSTYNSSRQWNAMRRCTVWDFGFGSLFPGFKGCITVKWCNVMTLSVILLNLYSIKLVTLSQIEPALEAIKGNCVLCCACAQSTHSICDCSVGGTVNWRLVRVMTIHTPLPGNWRRDGKLTHVSHHKKCHNLRCNRFASFWIGGMCSQLASPPPQTPRAEQLRIVQLIQCDSPNSQMQQPSHGNLSSVNTHITEQSAAEWNTSRSAADAVKRTTTPRMGIIGLWADSLSGSLPGRSHLRLLNRPCHQRS